MAGGDLAERLPRSGVELRVAAPGRVFSTHGMSTRTWLVLTLALVTGAAALGAGAAPQKPAKGRVDVWTYGRADVRTFPASPAPRPPLPTSPPPHVPTSTRPLSPSASTAESERFFTTRVKPILAANCIVCHSGEAPQGGLRLTTRAAVLKGGTHGPAVSTAKPEASLLVAAVNYQGRRMPPKGKLPQAQIEVLTRWVRMGLPWPGGGNERSEGGASLEPKTVHHAPPQVTPETMKFWAYQPVVCPPVPAVPDEWTNGRVDERTKGNGAGSSTRPLSPRQWVRTPVDAFILDRLLKAGLKPNPPASRQTLIRRATYDLHGLPPTPEKVDAFLADCEAEERSVGAASDGRSDPSASRPANAPALQHSNTPPTDQRPVPPRAWERLVDRLLASPRYGEKWGRHWLDLVRFAESNSYERDGTKPNAWRYRDYVIDAFNQDKPYHEFILEQLAGDELAPRTPERLIATGYYRLGLWDDEPADPEQALYDDLDDIASTTGQVFLGMTVGCARCHDHKIDPFPQKDYYRFLSFFSGVRRYGVRSEETVADASLRSIAPEEEQQKNREVVAAYQARVRAVQEEMEAIEKPVLADLTPVEQEEWQTPYRRAPIVKKRVPALVTQAQYDRYTALGELRREMFRNRPAALAMALCVTELPQPRDTFVLLRGNPHVSGEKVEPGFPSVLSPPAPQLAPNPNGDSAGRRLALARWIGSKENPLTARVMVNRVWQHHFGRGLVRSTSNFGFQGDRPTHPELLDWLAHRFAEGSDGEVESWSNGGQRRTGIGQHSSAPQLHHSVSIPARPWSLKSLHRLLMLSSAYRMSSGAEPRALAKDPENDLSWRFDMRRLEAEEVRDSILAANGTLNLKMGGPSFYPTIPAEVLAGQSMPGAGWGRSSPEEQCRRSVYIFVKRSLMTPMIAAFDGPETDFSCPVRFSTTQPTQALGMLNSAWMNEQAQIFAGHVRKLAGEEPAAQVRLCLRRTLQRAPTDAEVARGVRLMENLKSEEKASPEEALAAFCLVALNLNEFIYLD